MIVLFSDFGLHGPYIGQVKAVLAQRAPDQTVIDLFSDAPVFDIRCAAYLLAAYSRGFPSGTVFCAVVDPGVGCQQREGVIMQAGDDWFVGPDNGLFAAIAARHTDARCWRIDWQPDYLSATFHGRDIFAPVAAMIANGEPPPGAAFPDAQTRQGDWPIDYPAIIYCDHFGNAMTGIQATSLHDQELITVGNQSLHYARTYNDVAVGQGFWYRNANDLIEIAVNQGRATRQFDLHPCVPVQIEQ